MAKKSQIQKFREAARQAGADESEERFDTTLKALAKKPRKSDPADSRDKETKPKP